MSLQASRSSSSKVSGAGDGCTAFSSPLASEGRVDLTIQYGSHFIGQWEVPNHYSCQGVT